VQEVVVNGINFRALLRLWMAENPIKNGVFSDYYEFGGIFCQNEVF
jgi:hypothetical protein